MKDIPREQLSRRDLLKVMVGAALPTNLPNRVSAEPTQETINYFPNSAYESHVVSPGKWSRYETEDYPPLNLDYVREIVTTVQTEVALSPNEKAKTIINNLAIVQQLDPEGQVEFGSNAIKLDKSGIYLSAASSIRRSNGDISAYVEIMDYFTNVNCPVRSFVLHPKSGLAIIYAPNGQEQEVIPNIQLSSYKTGEKIWTYGIFLDFWDDNKLMIDKGIVGDPDETLRDRNPYAGNIPLLGTHVPYWRDGSSAVSREGNIVGIVNAETSFRDPNYKRGGTMTGVAGLSHFLDNGEIINFPDSYT